MPTTLHSALILSDYLLLHSLVRRQLQVLPVDKRDPFVQARFDELTAVLARLEQSVVEP